METKTLKISKQKAIELYGKLNDEGKAELEKIFGEKTFAKEKSITERVKNYADVCKIQGIHPVNDLPYPKPKNNRQKFMNQLFKLDNIAEVLNEGEILDFANGDQYKYWPWFEYNQKKAGFVFGFVTYDYSGTASGLGPRLCFKSEALAEFAGKTFLDEYNAALILTHKGK